MKPTLVFNVIIPEYFFSLLHYFGLLLVKNIDAFVEIFVRFVEKELENPIKRHNWCHLKMLSLETTFTLWTNGGYTIFFIKIWMKVLTAHLNSDVALCWASTWSPMTESQMTSSVQLATRGSMSNV